MYSTFFNLQSCLLNPSLKIPLRNSQFQSLKPSSFLQFSPSILVSPLRFVFTESLFQKNRIWGQRTMSVSSSIKCGNGDEGFRTLETESFFDGSEFSSEVAAGGLEPMLNKMSKWLVAALFAAVILFRHDAEALWFAMGSVINAILSVTLKKIINQERPIAMLKPDPGMPSSHAQSIFYTVVFVSLSAVEWLGVNEISSIVCCGLAFVFGSYFSYLRVSQKLHTVSQVLVGAVLGASFSILWYWFWKAVAMEAFAASLLVQVAVILGAFGFCLGFVIYVINNWFKDER